MEYYQNYIDCKTYGGIYNRYIKSHEYTRYSTDLDRLFESYYIDIYKSTKYHNTRGPAMKYSYILHNITITVEEYYLFGEKYKNKPRFVEYKNGVKTYELIDTDYDTIHNFI